MIIRRSLHIFFLLLIITGWQTTLANELSSKLSTWLQKTIPVKNGEGEVSAILTTPDKNAIYKAKAKYTFEVKNNTGIQQAGKVSYQVFTESGEKLNSDSIKVKIGSKSSEKYSFEIPETRAGFYKVNFMINVADYDDTTRRVFGIRPDEIVSPYKKPADFDDFWKTAKNELAKVAPNFKATLMPKMGSQNRNTYLIEMQSLDNVTIRGWMTVPKTGNKNKKFTTLVALPGYQVNLEPILGPDDDLAVITLNVRGQGNSRDVINTRKDAYIYHHLENKNDYVMRGVIMDCIRCIDFICSRPDLNHDQIMVSGGSMGGFLAIATASLDKRVALCSAQNPIFCDVHNLAGKVDWPITDFHRYAKTQAGITFDKIISNLDYYDTKNFASGVSCPILIGIGLLDNLAPPNNEYAAFNSIPGQKKRILVFRDLGHEVDNVYVQLEGHWMRDTFALF
jgi:cephalosporin-C deacetylase